jgi:hypothetical protein
VPEPPAGLRWNCPHWRPSSANDRLPATEYRRPDLLSSRAFDLVFCLCVPSGKFVVHAYPQVNSRTECRDAALSVAIARSISSTRWAAVIKKLNRLSGPERSLCNTVLTPAATRR